MMKMKKATVLISALLVSWPAFAPAGDEPAQDREAGPDQSDAMEILREADKATRVVEAVSYEAEFFGGGDYADRVPRFTGTVEAQERRRSLLGRLLGDHEDPDKTLEWHSVRIEGKLVMPSSDEERLFKVATDGKRVYRIDENKKVFIKGDMPKARGLLGSYGLHPLFMREYLHPTPFSDEINGKVARYEGVEVIGGVGCYVVYVVYANDSESRWYFGREDYLPRRVDRIFKRGDMSGTSVLVVTKLDTKPDLSRSDFRLECPEGFEFQEFVECKETAKAPKE